MLPQATNGPGWEPQLPAPFGVPAFGWPNTTAARPGLPAHCGARLLCVRGAERGRRLSCLACRVARRVLLPIARGPASHRPNFPTAPVSCLPAGALQQVQVKSTGVHAAEPQPPVQASCDTLLGVAALTLTGLALTGTVPSLLGLAQSLQVLDLV